MNIRTYITFIVFSLITLSTSAQRYNLGVRAGLNYSKFLGPAEEGVMEGSRLNNGIHFGFTFSYKFTERFGLKTELGYSAIGSRDSLVGESYYIFGIGANNIDKTGYVKKNLDVSNSYINIPFHAYVFPIKKLELFGGPYIGFLINPTAGGQLEFDDRSDDLKFSFIQSLDYNYYTDDARRGQGFDRTITVVVDDQTILMPRIAGAYYQFSEKDGGRFNFFDMGISAGAQYYINKSFFAGFRADLGLLDITRRKMDVAFGALDNGTYIFRDDFDRNFSMQFSLGFKF